MTNKPQYQTAQGLANYGVIEVKGQDAFAFLQGQLTADLKALTPGQGQLSAQCNPQGRVISLFFLFQTDDGYRIALPQSLTAITLAALKKYGVFYKQLQIISPDANAYSLVLHPEKPTQRGLAMAALPHHHYLTLETDTLPTDTRHTSAILIQLGLPELTAETSGIFLAHELNLIALHAASLTKGCYTGQEIITRMEHKAKLKKHMHLAKTETPLKNGEDIYLKNQERVVGTVVNQAPTSENLTIALLLLEDAATQEILCTREKNLIHLLTNTEHTND